MRYRKAAVQDDADAQWNLGEMYAYGKGVAKDENMAVVLYRKAAKQGNAQAQVNLGWCFANGVGVAMDKKTAYKLYRKAAEKGNAQAQVNLGLCFANGAGVAKNQETAYECYRKAAEQGNSAAQFELGRCFDSGSGVAMNKATACTWYRAVIELGNTKHHFAALMLLARSLDDQGLRDSAEAVEARLKHASAVPKHEHALIRSDVDASDENVLMCDICASPGVPATLWSCVQCDYDECEDCYVLHMHT